MVERKRRANGQRRFTLDYWRDGRWYVGRLREVPGVLSQARTLQQLKRNIIDAYKLSVNVADKEIGIPVGKYESTSVGIPP